MTWARESFTCLQILKPTINKWAQYPVQMEAQIYPYPIRILRALDDVLFRPSTHQNWPRDRKLTQSQLLVFALIFRLTRRCLTNAFACLYQTCSYTSLNRETVQQKYRNRVSECSCSPLSTCGSAIIAQLQRPECNGLYLGLGKTGKALLITSVSSNLTFKFKFYSMLQGGEDHQVTKYQQLDPILSIWAVVIRLTDIRFVEKNHSLLL